MARAKPEAPEPEAPELPEPPPLAPGDIVEFYDDEPKPAIAECRAELLAAGLRCSVVRVAGRPPVLTVLEG